MTNATGRFHPVAVMANGTTSGVYVHDLRGAQGDGPTLGVCAAIHGDEPTGTEIVLEVARRFGGGGFRGRLLLLPVANPLAFEANSRHTPADDQNLNRLFPGAGGGWYSEQLATVVTTVFLREIDALVDLHSGGDRPTVDYVYIRNAEALSRAFGSPVLYRADPSRPGTTFSGTSVSVTEERGVPSVTVELGGGRVDQGRYVSRGVRGVENVMGVLGMLDDRPVAGPAQTVVTEIATVRPRAGGLLETEAPALGETVALDEVLGRVVSPHTFEVLEEIVNPVERGIVILSHLTRNVVRPGDYAYMVGRPE